MSNEMWGKLIILDFDDTLFFTRYATEAAGAEVLDQPMVDKKAIRKLPKEVKGAIYNLAYSKYTSLMRPNTILINELKSLREDWDKMVVLSANSIKWEQQVAKLLFGAGLKVDEICMREDVSGADEQWKLDRIRSYLSKSAMARLYEDKMDNIEYINRSLNSDKIEFYLVSETEIKKVF